MTPESALAEASTPSLTADETAAILEAVRDFAQSELAPHAIEWQRNRFGIARLQLREVNLASVDRPLLDVVAIPEGSELIERVQGFIASS